VHVAIIDYGSGNLHSAATAILGIAAFITLSLGACAAESTAKTRPAARPTTKS
jgi:imidazoleglycerol phosphate synthase glutamine amidotransferase subunit HisH